MTDQIHVAHTTDVETHLNPYMRRLCDALSAQGFASSSTRARPLELLRLRRAGHLDVLHLHWPEYLGFVRRGNPARAAFNAYCLARLATALAYCRLAGVRVAWTVHNVRPHHPETSRAALLAYRLLARSVHVAFAHSAAAARVVEARYPALAGRVLVTPHGNYDADYPAPSAPAPAIRREHGIPDAPVVLLAFGQLRPYKRITELAEVVAAAPGLHLVVAGATDPAYRDAVHAACRGEQITLIDRRVSDQEVADLYAAADAAVLNYADLFSSGALLLALSMGAAVLVRDSPAAAEVAGWPALLGYHSEAELPQAAARLTEVPADDRRRAARDAAAAATWERMATATARGYVPEARA